MGSFHHKSQHVKLPLIVVGEDGPTLLGLSWLYSLHLDALLRHYSALFSENLGTLKGFKAKLFVDEGRPIFCKARPVPYALRVLVEAEIDKLVIIVN